MHSTQLLVAVVSVVTFVAGAPQIQQGQEGVPPLNCPATICIDGINTACPSVRWGGCYDACRPSLRPTVSPCPEPTKPTKSITKMTGKPSPRPVSPKPSGTGNCSTRTICIDYVNECGQWYGGCHADCRPWPSYTAPPCPSTTADKTFSLPYITSETEQTYSLPFMTAEPEPEQTYSLPYFPA